VTAALVRTISPSARSRRPLFARRRVDGVPVAPPFRSTPQGRLIALARGTLYNSRTGCGLRCGGSLCLPYTPAELPPAVELIEAIADVIGIAEAGHGWIPSTE
jgi:hypothetical protein